MAVGRKVGGFEVKDSGKRTEFESGMVRDTADDKADYTLVYDGPMLDRWAAHLTLAASSGKYEKRNWMKADSQAEHDRFVESAARHFRQWLRGDRDEDHAAAVYFNINGAEYTRERLEPRTPGRNSTGSEPGKLPKETGGSEPSEPQTGASPENSGLSSKPSRESTEKPCKCFCHSLGDPVVEITCRCLN